jgi:hypothetical protein
LIQVNATSPPARQPTAVTLEEKMTTNEFYYLMLVLGSFVAFALGVGWSMIQYRAWVKKTGQRIQSAE